jgi:hypothetical protein
MATSDTSDHLRKGTKVVARAELRDVPEGTRGKVIMVSGITWIRYWVRFDNGISLGSIDRQVLATADEWKRYEQGEDVWGEVAADDTAAEGGEASGGEGGGGGRATPSGTVVPQKLLDRAAAARARLAA